MAAEPPESVDTLAEPLELSDGDFIARYVQSAPQIMWFLGAGTSRTAGMPTATDIIWDLKRNYYCRQENQDIQQHDINNESVKRKIQSYMDSKSFPALWSAEEYSFYFDLTFKTDYAEQQKYLTAQLSPDKISLNIGHRVLAALLEMGKAKLAFTTNFDTVIERAHAEVTAKDLATYMRSAGDLRAVCYPV
jgi:NAD-dependent SIR2 family protein deacetylase